MWSEQVDKLYSKSDDSEVPILQPELHKSNQNLNIIPHSASYRELTGFGIGFAGFFGEILISHPFVVLRRQCQSRSSSDLFHLMPFTMLPVIKRLVFNQGMSTLWKGLTSSFVVHGLVIGVESLCTEFYSLPREITRHTSTKRIILHVLLKFISWSIVTPFYAEHIVESVQTDIASEESGILSCIYGGFRRFWIPRNFVKKPAENSKPLKDIRNSIRDKFSLGTSRLLPYWSILGPVVCLNVGYYVCRGLATMAITNYFQLETRDTNSMGSSSSLREQFTRESSSANMTQLKSNREQKALQETYMKYYNDLWVGMCSSFCADVVLYPIETITVRLCVQGTRTLIDNLDNGDGVLPIVSSYENYLDIIGEAARSEFGYLSLYRGFGSIILQYSLQALFLYSVKRALEHVLVNYTDNPKPNVVKAPKESSRYIGGSSIGDNLTEDADLKIF